MKKGYMCTIDFDWELGDVATKVYATLDELKADHKCWEDCGIVEVGIMVTEDVVKARRIKQD